MIKTTIQRDIYTEDNNIMKEVFTRITTLYGIPVMRRSYTFSNTKLEKDNGKIGFGK
jgi:hypothetical protein